MRGRSGNRRRGPRLLGGSLAQWGATDGLRRGSGWILPVAFLWSAGSSVARWELLVMEAGQERPPTKPTLRWGVLGLGQDTAGKL